MSNEQIDAAFEAARPLKQLRQDSPALYCGWCCNRVDCCNCAVVWKAAQAELVAQVRERADNERVFLEIGVGADYIAWDDLKAILDEEDGK